MLESLRAVEGDRLGKVEFVDNEAIIPKLQSKGVISKVFPLHKHEDLNVLKKTWVTAFTKPQPLGGYHGLQICKQNCQSSCNYIFKTTLKVLRPIHMFL